TSAEGSFGSFNHARHMIIRRPQSAPAEASRSIITTPVKRRPAGGLLRVDPQALQDRRTAPNSDRSHARRPARPAIGTRTWVALFRRGCFTGPMVHRAAWLTDIHLNFVTPSQVTELADTVRRLDVDSVLIGGDIGEAPTFAGYLEELAERIGRPVYFVLGN